jgi:ribosome biogenesis GTPase A
MLTGFSWRVTEISQILLVLLDSRCPLLHYPPALASYLAGQTVILVLTKVDITGSARADAWAAYFKALHPGIRVVQVESYTAKPTGAYTQGQSLPESSTIESKHRAALEPHIPLPFREKLVEALREAHAELLQPPEKIRNDEQKLKKWKPRVKKEIDWNAVLDAHGGQVGHAVGGATAPRPTEEPENEEDGDLEPEHLTIGLIGEFDIAISFVCGYLINN